MLHSCNTTQVQQTELKPILNTQPRNKILKWEQCQSNEPMKHIEQIEMISAEEM